MSGAARALRHWIESADHGLMRRFHGWIAPSWFRWWMVASTRAGDGWLWYAAGAVLVAAGGSSGRLAAAEALAACAGAILLFQFLKRKAGRRRPCELAPHCWARILPPDEFSFPSGHTMTAFAAAGPIAAHFPQAAPMLYFCAGSIALSRVALGMHFLSDVVAGGLLGWLIGNLAHWLLS
ncbi:MAG: phosphatase PAP2 family protein [Bryobacteraceae bacterium]|nr:MAG: phosphatase PAP2 family protein [Bryobacteraceae bacterium]